ncbi:MAG TPA: hypothetical protein VGN11_03360 [Candidatus Baltobacteraceae bacterium]|jgi:hypothetical protein|nr:hypothetical protein [Candidatus Baltobacteraceae bacterium]
MSVSFVGSDILFAPSRATAAPARTASQPAQNPFQTTYDSLQTWSDQYLFQSIESGAPPVPEYTDGSSASSFAQLSNLLAQIAPGVANGTYGGGAGGIDTLA